MAGSIMQFPNIWIEQIAQWTDVGTNGYKKLPEDFSGPRQRAPWKDSCTVCQLGKGKSLFQGTVYHSVKKSVSKPLHLFNYTVHTVKMPFNKIPET